ncbi:C4-dicarboxylate ABC transporter [Pokkaliibacter plantistimulans]|uniref:C4-dicarboxylate ABC transporter n=1 Tax=Pokkaliibacter plantistimulans TaxID=1635171 RepID=A0ABX5LRC3_9GAMM|nr:TRAP transporter permease [Pokkaliibacter plantistimulans]PXF29197.1 C4-dicarboxylate ABC transporter [Pokkaliibacter plantistimulans]
MSAVDKETSGVTGSESVSRGVFWIALAFVTFQLITAIFSPLSSQVVRSVHVGFLLALIFWMAADQYRPALLKALFMLLAVGSFVLGLYHWVFEADLVLRSGDPSMTDMVVGTLMVSLVFVGAYRLMGPALPLICLLFVLYGLFGEYMPGLFESRGYGVDQVINQLFLGTEGIFGIPTYVSSSYIFLFILFGSFLEQAGMIRLFNDVALGLVGSSQGGPAKVSVISSAMMGTINGSGVANVVTTGQFTIPLMKRFGYQPAFAGAVEATSSMGGQIMPPVMGAVAFIMAETLNVPYIDIVKAALVPAILYFVTVLWMVHLEAGRLGLFGLSKEECPNAWLAFKRDWYLIIPLAVLVFLLFSGYTPLFSGSVGLAMTALVILGSPLALRMSALWQRVLFWVALGLLASTFFKYGMVPVLLVIALLVLFNLLRKGRAEALHLTVQGMVQGALHALPVGIACALVGTIIAIMTLTGLAGNLTQAILSLGAGSLFLSLVLTMLTSLVLGMGIPTIPNYIITSSLVAPVLLELGVPLIVSHMFVFYFGIMADLTPPVALAAFAAAPIASASGLKISLNCLRIAMAGFVVPYMAVYSPALMLQGDSYMATAYVVVKALVAIGLGGAASIGFLFERLRWWERCWAAVAALSLVVALPATDEAGFALSASFIAWHWWRRRQHAALAIRGQ